MKESRKSFIFMLLGVVIVAIGLVLIRTVTDPTGIMIALPYVCVGVGCGLWGHFMGELINHKVVQKHPELQKQNDIEKNDERNLAIINRAKAKAYDCMIFIYGALLLTISLMEVAMAVVLLLVGSYLAVVLFNIYFRIRYEKEM